MTQVKRPEFILKVQTRPRCEICLSEAHYRVCIVAEHNGQDLCDDHAKNATRIAWAFQAIVVESQPFPKSKVGIERYYKEGVSA